jgi:pantoate--beta-alanine ligase
MLDIETKSDLRARCEAARSRGMRVGLVPTMGYLHEGHLSLIRAARSATDFVVVTIFVNPLQFGPSEDLERYPRDLAADLANCEREGVDCVFTPAVQEMYPEAPLTTVHVAELTSGLCGTARPTHFDGVTTVVAKLFSIVGPCTAFFGRKDAQQLAVVTRMASDLDLPVDVVGCPLVREPDGLALSSRNAYLSAEQRTAARVLSRALGDAVDRIAAGERDPVAVVAEIEQTIACEPAVALDYVTVCDARTMSVIERIDGDVLVALAAVVGTTRLIDNVRVVVDGDAVVADLGTRYERA